MNETSKQNVADLIESLARWGTNDRDIAERMGLTVSQVRSLRHEFNIPAGERRWLPTRRPDATA